MSRKNPTPWIQLYAVQGSQELRSQVDICDVDVAIFVDATEHPHDAAIGLCPLRLVDSEQEEFIEPVADLLRKIDDAHDNHSVLVLLPASSYGIHPLHFGIMFIVNLELGYLTPPLGINLFVASTVFKRPVVDVMKAALPFLFLMLFCLAVIIFFPFLSLALL